MKQSKNIVKIASFSLIVLGLAAPLLAAAGFPSQTLPGGITSKTDLLSKVDTLLNWIFTFFIVLATLFLILAGLQFITAGGEPAKIEEARKKLMYAVMGIIVALIAKGIPTVIKDILGVK